MKLQYIKPKLLFQTLNGMNCHGGDWGNYGTGCMDGSSGDSGISCHGGSLGDRSFFP